MKRIDRAARTIAAPPEWLYAALLDREALAEWLAPDGARVEIGLFEPREGGRFRTTLRFDPETHPAPGKTAAHEDVVRGRFVRLAPAGRWFRRSGSKRTIRPLPEPWS